MKIKRLKQVRKSLAFYKKNFGYSPPYYVLVDGTFCKAALQQKINISEQLPKYLEAEVNICTTQCTLTECEAFGSLLYGPLKVLQQFQRAPCGHSKHIKGADKCIQHTVKKTVKYIVATQDPLLREVLRGRQGQPILFIAFNAITIENPSKASLEAADKKCEEQILPSHQKSVIQKLKKQTFGEEVVIKQKRKKIKGPNPLSCKVSKKKKVLQNRSETSTSENVKRKRKRKRHKKFAVGQENGLL